METAGTARWMFFAGLVSVAVAVGLGPRRVTADDLPPLLPLTPVINVIPSGPVDFGKVCVDQCADTTFALLNGNPDPASVLRITELYVQTRIGLPRFFLIDPPELPLLIAGGEPPVPLVVRFCPEGPEPKAGILTIRATWASPPNPLILDLSGHGNREPVCVAGGPYSGVQGEPIQFDGSSSSDPDGEELTFLWDFGDGGSAIGPTPTHVYADCDTYSVTLTVGDGCVEQSSSEAVDVSCRPLCDAGGPYAGGVGQLILFDGSNSTDPDGTVVSYAWDFGDGESGTGPMPTHAYASEGTYTVELCVTDDENLTVCCLTEAVVAPTTNDPPICDAGGPYAGHQGDPISFDGTGSTDPDGMIVLYAWDFGDGQTAAGPTPTHIYTSCGPFTVSLTVADDLGAAAICETVADVNCTPLCHAGGPYTGVEGQPVELDGSNSTDPDGTIARYDWDFGDGTTAPDAGPNPEHIYSAPGSFVVGLCVSDDRQGTTCCDTEALIQARPNEPPLCDAGGPYSGVEGLPVEFDGSSSTDPDGMIVRYDWDFGDGWRLPAGGPNPTHAYTSPGVFIVQLCVIDDRLARACCLTEARIAEQPNEPPICDAGGPYAGGAGQLLLFDGSNSTDPGGVIVLYDWDFGDGESGTGPMPVHAYDSDGAYAVELCVTDDDNDMACCLTETVIAPTTNLSPICDAGGPYAGNEGDPISFDGSNSTDPDGSVVFYAWEFGDGHSANGPAPTHTYTGCGPFTVSLTVADDLGAAAVCETAADVNCAPTCDAGGPYEAYPRQPIVFDGSNSTDPDGTIESYQWDFGDGSTGSGVSPEHTYASSGTYTVQLCVTDDEAATRCCETAARIIGLPDCTPLAPSTRFILRDNGPLITGACYNNNPPGCESRAFPSYSVAGYDHGRGDGLRVADDFTVPAGTQWNIQAIIFFAYQPGADPLAPTITHLNLRVWDGEPGTPGAGVICGDTTTNLLVLSAWTLNYRTTSSAPCDDDLAVMANIVLMPEGCPRCPGFPGTLLLDPGTYWLDWQSDGALASGTWVPPVTPPFGGPPPNNTGNAIQFDGDDWRSLPHAEDLPFILEGDFCGVTPVTVRSFDASGSPGGVRVSWSVTSTEDILGYDLLAAPEEDGTYIRANPALLSPETMEYTHATEGRHFYRLEVVWLDGGRERHGPIMGVPGAPAPSLSQNHPNPFCESTEIRFSAPRDQHVTIDIFDVRGKLVTRVYEGLGGGTAAWDGRSAGGRRVAAGVYFYEMRVGGKAIAKKLIVLSER